MIRLVPWFGRSWIDRQRAELVRSLARGTRIGLSEREILLSAAKGTRARWVNQRCRKTFSLIEGGATLPVALYRSGVVSGREQPWLVAAERNGTLSIALENLASDVQRRSAYRWRFRMAWFVPLATLLLGGYVLVHAFFLFQALYYLSDMLA